MLRLLDLSIAMAGGLILAAAAAWCLSCAIRFERPDWRVSPWLATAAWWMGQALAAMLLLILGGGLVGLIARAGWRLLGD